MRNGQSDRPHAYHDEFSAQGRFGRAGEQAVRQRFLAMGKWVVPVHAIEDGGAPALISSIRRLTLLDFQVFGEDDFTWVEVKTKTAPDFYQRIGRWRHGLDTPKWQAYLQVLDVTKKPGLLAILQIRPGPNAPPAPLLLTAPFARLRGREQFYVGPTIQPRVWFDVDLFDREEIPLDLTQFPIIKPGVVHPWEKPRASGSIPQIGPRQEELF